MGNNILDNIFNDKLRNQLEEGEVVVWEGKPQFNNYSRLIVVGFIFLFFGFYIINFIINEEYWAAALFTALLIVSIIRRFFQQKKTRYILTNTRIIFQLPDGARKTKIQSLPLNHVEDVIYNEGYSKNGTIALSLKKSFRTDIQTYDIRKNTKHKHPTLEMIENVEEVSKYIDLGTQGKL